MTKCENQLKEILCVDAHIEEITHAARYIQFYENAASSFEKETTNIMSELFEAMDGNYTYIEEYEQQHLQLFHDAFTLLDSGSTSQKEHFDELITTWNSLR